MSETRRKFWRFPEPVDETAQPEPPTPENTSSMVRLPDKPKKKKAWRCSACGKRIGNCDCPESDDDWDDDDDPEIEEDDDDEFDF